MSPADVDWITVDQAQARGCSLVCTDPNHGPQLGVGDIITHVASGVDLRVVRVINEWQALARRPRWYDPLVMFAISDVVRRLPDRRRT